MKKRLIYCLAGINQIILAVVYVYFHYINIYNHQLAKWLESLDGIPVNERSKYPSMMGNLEKWEMIIILLVILLVVLSFIALFKKEFKELLIGNILLAILIISIIHIPLIILYGYDLMNCSLLYINNMKILVISLVICLGVVYYRRRV